MTLAATDLDAESVDRFFWYARERHLIYLKRRAGLPRPWTAEPTMSQYSITNVFRELDKTTAWFREYVRYPLRNDVEVLLATVVFRWFNTIRSGETMFRPDGVKDEHGTPFRRYLRSNDPADLLEPLRRQGPPWVTGAYMIKSPTGMDKLDGIVKSIHDFRNGKYNFEGQNLGWKDAAHLMMDRREIDPVTLHDMWLYLCEPYGLGKFLSYELVTDLRFTALGDRAPDIMTWANPGPGALRGANLILRGAAEVGRKGRLKKATYPETHEVMRILLELSRDPQYWPQMYAGGVQHDSSYVDQIEVGLQLHREGENDWPSWEMREPEMFLCEYAKLERTRLGLGRPRSTYP